MRLLLPVVQRHAPLQDVGERRRIERVALPADRPGSRPCSRGSGRRRRRARSGARAPRHRAAARCPIARSARAISAASAGWSSRLSTRTWQRDSSAPVSAKDGFSVVAPIRVTVPSSTWASSPSCWARLKRWISSMNRSVVWPVRRRALRLLVDLAQVGHPGHHRRELHQRLAEAPGEQAGERGLAGAGRPPQDDRAELAAREHAPERRVRAEQMVLADQLVEVCGRSRSASGWPAATPARPRAVLARENRSLIRGSPRRAPAMPARDAGPRRCDLMDRDGLRTLESELPREPRVPV